MGEGTLPLGTQGRWRPEGLQAQVLRKPGVLEGLRVFLVVVAPFLLLDAVVGASVVATAVGALKPPRRRARAWRWLAAAGALAPWVYKALRPRLLYWGATGDEARRPLPGDEVVPHGSDLTRAITLRAPVEEVWAWLLQIGCWRGGWFSHDFFDRMAGVAQYYDGWHSAQRIIPELQRLAVGDIVRMGPWTGVGEWRVVRMEPPRVLVYQYVQDPRSSWAYVLEPVEERTTRLLVRWRSNPDPRSWASRIQEHLIELPHFIMERRMLLNLRDRVERGGAGPQGSPGRPAPSGV
jgi:hypothetical protein